MAALPRNVLVCSVAITTLLIAQDRVAASDLASTPSLGGWTQAYVRFGVGADLVMEDGTLSVAPDSAAVPL